MSEKRVDESLTKMLTEFDQNNIFYSISECKDLKDIFKIASKNNKNNIGIPDRTYYDKENKIIIVFECKSKNLKLAIDDLKKYASKMIIEGFAKYFVAYVNNYYEIYDAKFNKINKSITPKTFGISTSNKEYTQIEMENSIHAIHNYIRDHTKISNEDKTFFIACILIALRKESFCLMYNKIKISTKKYIYDLIKQSLIDFNIDFSVFDFLKNDTNNTHFINIIDMVKDVLNNNMSQDVLNRFYNEFIQYSNTDGKSLGIVLTPPHIVELMISMLEIEEKDTFLDLCSGTGSFALEALKYNPSKLISCEYQNKLYVLSKCNMILRNLDPDNYIIIKDDCFNQDFAKFKPTKSAINPPYGMKTKRELDFVLKQLSSIEEGLVCAIIPCSCLNKSELRNSLLEHGIIKKIVICNNDLFYPSASVKTCIILIEKTKSTKQGLVTIDNFEDDGFQIKRTYGRIKVGEGTHNEKQINIDEHQDTWIHFDIVGDVTLLAIRLADLEISYQNKRYELLTLDNCRTSILPLSDNCSIEVLQLSNNKETITYKEFLISDLFVVRKKPSTPYKEDKYVNEIAAKNNNNGVKGIVKSDKDTFKGNKIVLVQSGNGGAGMAFYQELDFKITSSTIVLAPKKSLNLDRCLETYIATELSKYKKKYSRGFTWTIDRIKNDIIVLPTINGSIHREYIRSLLIINSFEKESKLP